MMDSTLLYKKITSLPEDLKKQVEDFIDSLTNKRNKKEDINDSPKITSLSGLGSEIWKGVDIDKYVENERQW